MKITVDQIPAKIVKAYFINDALEKEEALITGYYNKYFEILYDNVKYIFHDDIWYAYSGDELYQLEKFDKDFIAANSDNFVYDTITKNFPDRLSSYKTTNNLN